MDNDEPLKPCSDCGLLSDYLGVFDMCQDCFLNLELRIENSRKEARLDIQTHEEPPVVELSKPH